MPIINGYYTTDDEINRIKETTTQPEQVVPATTFWGGMAASAKNIFHFIADPENITDWDYIPTKGFYGTAGELLNPINFVIGGALGELAGAAVGTIGDLIPEALASYGFKAAASNSEKLINSTIANKALTTLPNISKGAIEGAGWTALDKAEEEVGNGNPSFSGQDLLLGAGFGSTIEGLAPLVKKLYLQGMKNKDSLYGSTVAVRDRQYNPQNGLGYNLKTEVGKSPDINISSRNISNELLDKVGIEPQGKVFDNQKEILSHVQGLIDSGIKSDEIPDMIQGIINHTEAKYSNMVDELTRHDPTIKRHLYNNSYADPIDMGIKRALDGDLDNSTIYDKNSANIYNTIDKSLVDEYNSYGGNLSYIPGYRRQVHDVDRMLADNNYFTDSSKPQEWAEFIKPLLSNDISIDRLKETFQDIVKAKDKEDIFGKNFGINNKARVFTFKNADAENKYANRFGYKKSVALHLIDNVKGISRVIAIQKLFKDHDPKLVMNYLGRFEGKTKDQIERRINRIARGKLSKDMPALSTATQAIVTTSRAANAIAAPFFNFFKNLPLDVATTFTHAWLRSDLITAIKSMVTKEKPVGALKSMATLPFEDRENFKNFLNDFKSETKIHMLEGMGINTKDNLSKGLIAANRMAIKYSGLHTLDAAIRKLADKSSTYIINQQFKKDGLASLLPRANKKILAESLNEHGQLDPFILEQKAIEFAKQAKITENIEQKNKLLNKHDAYQNTANRLHGLYSTWRNGINPLYSSEWIGLRKLDPAVGAGARGLLWHLTTLKKTFDLAKIKWNTAPNKFMAGASIAGIAIASAAAEHTISSMFNYLEGKKEHQNDFINFASKILDVPEDNDLLNITGNVIGNIFYFSSLYNSSIWYGSAAQAVRSAKYEIKGNEEKAKEALKKASPYAMIFTNLLAN